jgi:hypothetical protein
MHFVDVKSVRGRAPDTMLAKSILVLTTLRTAVPLRSCVVDTAQANDWISSERLAWGRFAREPQ